MGTRMNARYHPKARLPMSGDSRRSYGSYGWDFFNKAKRSGYRFLLKEDGEGAQPERRDQADRVSGVTRRQCMLIFVDLPLAIGRTSTFLSHRGLIPIALTGMDPPVRS